MDALKLRPHWLRTVHTSVCSLALSAQEPFTVNLPFSECTLLLVHRCRLEQSRLLTPLEQPTLSNRMLHQARAALGRFGIT